MDTEKSIIIFTATHVHFDPPENPIYVPLHVGRQGKADLGYIGDNVGENISELNPLYGELTGLYWIWQNIRDIDYVGFCHYRRFFLNGQGKEMTREDYLSLLEKYDVIVPRHGECDGSYLEHYGRAHNGKDLEAVGRALKRLYPECRETFDSVMAGRLFFSGNLMVTKLAVLKEYAGWLFSVFAEASDEIDVSGYDNYHRRVYGFLSEQMLYVYMKAYGLTFCEATVGISQEKAETKALKEKLAVLLAQGQREKAKEVFEAALNERPDLLLAGSDVYGDLAKLKRQIFGEGEMDEEPLLDVSGTPGTGSLPILLIVPDDTCYGTLKLFAIELGKALERQGERIVSTDGSVGDKLNPDVFLTSGWKGVVGFQAPSLEKEIFRMVKAPKFQFWLDNPCMCENMLRYLPANYHILCQDSGYAEFIRRYFHTPGAVHFPPAGIAPLSLRERDGDCADTGGGAQEECREIHREKIYDIVFVGSDFPEEEMDRDGMEGRFYHYMIAHPAYTFEHGFLEFHKEYGLHFWRSTEGNGEDGMSQEIPEGTLLRELYRMRHVCRNVSNYFRRQVIRDILDAGYDIEVFGDSWKNFGQETYGGAAASCGGRLHIHPALNAAEVPEVLARSKVSLNVMTWHKSGMTERIATSMLSGAACLSDETSYLKEHFADGEEIALFRLDDRNGLIDRLKELLADDKWMEIAEKGQRKAQKEHTWDVRAGALLRMIDEK